MQVRFNDTVQYLDLYYSGDGADVMAKTIDEFFWKGKRWEQIITNSPCGVGFARVCFEIRHLNILVNTKDAADFLALVEERQKPFPLDADLMSKVEAWRDRDRSID
jgi:hypothetical protein